MEPYKKLHLSNPSHNYQTKSQAKSQEAMLSELLNNVKQSDDALNESSGSADIKGGNNKKIRKRRTLSETSKRDFKCGCGKNYVSYPAIYLHIQRKHNSVTPPNTVIPEKPENKDKVKRGRPKKEKNNMLDIPDADVEVKYKSEDNFWLFIGTKGLTASDKADNKFINNLEAPKYDTISMFPKQFLSDYYYENLIKILQILDSQTIFDPKKSDIEIAKIPMPVKQVEKKFGYFISWVSNPLREEIFQEMCMVLCFLRRIVLDDIWFSKVGHKLACFSHEPTIRESLTRVLGQQNAKTKEFVDFQVRGIIERKRYPSTIEKYNLFGNFYSENGHSKVMELLQTVYKDNIWDMVCERLNQLADKETNNADIEEVACKILLFKEKELQLNQQNHAGGGPIKFNFASKETLEDLKELIMHLAEWLASFDENDLKVKEIDFGDDS
jgi:hypothetical protein